MSKINLQLIECGGNGNCFYLCASYHIFNDTQYYKLIRLLVALALEDDDYFNHYIYPSTPESKLDMKSEDIKQALVNENNCNNYNQWINNIINTNMFACREEIIAFSQLFGVISYIVTKDEPPFKIIPNWNLQDITDIKSFYTIGDNSKIIKFIKRINLNKDIYEHIVKYKNYNKTAYFINKNNHYVYGKQI
jgi:hypothetical protein